MIDFKNVTKIYDNGTRALDGINLHVDKGEFVFVVGASGSGKSTFLKIIMKEEVPTSGEVMVNGIDVCGLRHRHIPCFRRKMGIVFQDFRLINNMSVYDNVAFAMRVIGNSEREIKKRVPYVLGLVGLNEKINRFPLELSGGEQQRVGLARAIVNQPTLIIADEPTGNVDPEMSYEIMDLLNEIYRQGTTVVVVTHEHHLLEKFKHRVIEISSGEISKYIPEGRNEKV